MVVGVPGAHAPVGAPPLGVQLPPEWVRELSSIDLFDVPALVHVCGMVALAPRPMPQPNTS